MKIDKTFISDLPDDQDDAAITETIMGLAKNLKLHTVAEGVETPEQLRYLQQLGCNIGQGYLLDRPLWPEDLEKRLHTGDYYKLAALKEPQ